MTQSYYKLDLHTHSILSPDGSIRKKDYERILNEKILSAVAITDHNTIDYALEVQQSLGERIIVGEEIWSSDGEVIGLFLQKQIPRNLSLAETFALIQEQGGIIYIPHPFCRNRFGVSEEALLPLIDQVDVIEYFNPRNVFHGDNARASAFTLSHKLPMAASSDSHCALELGKTYSTVSRMPTRANLVFELEKAQFSCRYTTRWHLLCPKKNKIKKLLGML